MLTTLLITTKAQSLREIEQEILDAIRSLQGLSKVKESLEESTQETISLQEAKSILETTLKKSKKEELKETIDHTNEEEHIVQPPLRDRFVDGVYESGYSFDPNQAELFSYTSQFGKSYYDGSTANTKEQPQIVYVQEGETFSNKQWEQYMLEKKMESITRVNRTYTDALPRMMHTGTEDEQLRTFISKISWIHSWNKVKYMLALN